MLARLQEGSGETVERLAPPWLGEGACAVVLETAGGVVFGQPGADKGPTFLG